MGAWIMPAAGTAADALLEQAGMPPGATLAQLCARSAAHFEAGAGDLVSLLGMQARIVCAEQENAMLTGCATMDRVYVGVIGVDSHILWLRISSWACRCSWRVAVPPSPACWRSARSPPRCSPRSMCALPLPPSVTSSSGFLFPCHADCVILTPLRPDLATEGACLTLSLGSDWMGSDDLARVL